MNPSAHGRCRRSCPGRRFPCPSPALPPPPSPPLPALHHTLFASVASRPLTPAGPTPHRVRCGRRQDQALRLQSEVQRIASHLAVSGALTGTLCLPPYEPAADGANAHGAYTHDTNSFAAPLGAPLGTQLGTPPVAAEGSARQEVCEELEKLERALRPAHAPPPPAEAPPPVPLTRASVADELSRISYFLQEASV